MDRNFLKNRFAIWLIKLLLVFTGVFLTNTSCAGAFEAGSQVGSITGVLKGPDGRLLAGGEWLLAVFPVVGLTPSPDDPVLQVLPARVAQVDGNARFNIMLSPGKYQFSARKLPVDRSLSPLQENEQGVFAYDREKKSLRHFLLQPGEEVDAGVINMSPAGKEVSEELFFSVQGTVVDEANNPKQGMLVVAKKDFNQPKPLFATGPTEADGRFHLKLPAGDFYLLSRQVTPMFGRPQIGEYIGIYGIDSPMGIRGAIAVGSDGFTPVSGKGGEQFEKVIIKVFPIPDPKKMKKLRQAGAG